MYLLYNYIRFYCLKEGFMKRFFSVALLIGLSLSVFSDTVFFIPENNAERYGLNISRSSRSSVPERLNMLCNEMKHTDTRLKVSLERIGELINKQWYLNSEFEKDLNIMLQMFRESIDYISNLEDRSQALEMELFNPEELPFSELYSNLEAVKKDTDSSYKELSKGKSGLKEGRKFFSKASQNYSSVNQSVIAITSAVSGAVPYNPPVIQPTPAPVAAEPEFDYEKMEVKVLRKRLKLSDHDFIRLDSEEGKTVIKKSMERLHELTSIDRFLYKEALKKKEGYTITILKDSRNRYIIY